MDTGFPETHAHVKLLIEGDYRFSFGFPVGIPAAIEALRSRLKSTAEKTGSDPAEAMLPLLMTLAPLSSGEQSEMQTKLNMMLCGVILHLSEVNNEPLEAGKFYQFDMRLDDDDIVAEMHELEEATVH